MYTARRRNKRKVTFTTIYFVAVTVGLDSSSVIVQAKLTVSGH